MLKKNQIPVRRVLKSSSHTYMCSLVYVEWEELLQTLSSQIKSVE